MLLEAVKAKNPEFGEVNIMKAKKAVQTSKIFFLDGVTVEPLSVSWDRTGPSGKPRPWTGVPPTGQGTLLNLGKPKHGGRS